jgi:uncharacterized protein (TIGR00255 family)
MKSMTGYGRAVGTLPDGTEATVVVRGVNHRFLDVSLKLRDEYAALEPQIRRAVGAAAARGHVDVAVRTSRPPGRTASFDQEAAARYVGLWKSGAEGLGLPAELTARDLLALPGVVRAEDSGEPDETALQALLALVAAAVEDFDRGRRREGEALADALGVVLERLEGDLARLDEERTGLAERLMAVVGERVRRIAEEHRLDEGRLAQEVAMLADRADISEEIDRLKTHVAEFRRLVRSDGAVGKRLDFLAQELHREVNTSGQKVREIGATRAVLDLKSQVEALKEQLQNVE